MPAAKPPAPEWDDVRLLKLRRLRLKAAALDAGDVKAFLEARVHGLSVQRLALDKTIKVEALYGSVALSAELAPELVAQPAGLKLHLVEARVGVTKLPSFITAPFQDTFVSFAPNPETPFAIDVP